MVDYGAFINRAFEANVNSARTSSLASGLPCLDAREALAPLADLHIEDLVEAISGSQ